MANFPGSKLFAAAAAFGAIVMLPVAPLVAQADSDGGVPDYMELGSEEVANLSTLTCWDVTTLTEDDRAFAMVLLYGYAKGVAGDDKLAPRDIQVAIVNAMIQCVDEPDREVLDVLREYISHEAG